MVEVGLYASIGVVSYMVGYQTAKNMWQSSNILLAQRTGSDEI
jgi:hypothetical protein